MDNKVFLHMSYNSSSFELHYVKTIIGVSIQEISAVSQENLIASFLTSSDTVPCTFKQKARRLKLEIEEEHGVYHLLCVMILITVKLLHS